MNFANVLPDSAFYCLTTMFKLKMLYNDNLKMSMNDT
jgi:hypothetical protein